MAMIESFLITSRETLEASLVIGIVLAYLDKTNNKAFQKSVWLGVTAGIVASILAAVGFTLFSGGFEGKAEELFEGITMLIGAFLLTTMILWMIQQREIRSHLESRVGKHLEKAGTFFSHWGIFLLIFFAVLREGVETVIFLNAASFAGGMHAFGGFLGVAVAIVIGYLFFMGAEKIKLKHLFTWSSVLLILFAAGLVAHGWHELEEAGVAPSIIYPLYNLNPDAPEGGPYPLLHENGIAGSFMKGLFGYNANPSLAEVIIYLSYLIIIFGLFVSMHVKPSHLNTLLT